MLLHTVIVSTVATGQVMRRLYLSAQEAHQYGASRQDRGHRVEVVTRDLAELSPADLHGALVGLSNADLDAVCRDLEEVDYA